LISNILYLKIEDLNIPPTPYNSITRSHEQWTPTPTVVPSATGRRHTGDRNQNGRISSQFIPKTPGIEILDTSTEQRGHNFAKFLKSIHHHAMTTFRHSKDISSAFLEFKDPLAVLRLHTL